MTFYGRTLAVPAMRDVDDAGRARGRRAVRVDSAARAATRRRSNTGDSDVAALANQEIHPYTDLLLHDMGPGLADGRPDFEATGQEWRTPPLWGIGLVDDVTGAPLPAPRRPGGDDRGGDPVARRRGRGGREAFREAAVEDRRRLLAFLEAL